MLVIMDQLMALSWQGWLTLVVIFLTTVTMARERFPPDMCMFGGLCVLVVTGVLTPQEALSGAAMPAVATIGVLFVCAAAVRETGGLTTAPRPSRPALPEARLGEVLLPLHHLHPTLSPSPWQLSSLKMPE